MPLLSLGVCGLDGEFVSWLLRDDLERDSSSIDVSLELRGPQLSNGSSSETGDKALTSLALDARLNDGSGSGALARDELDDGAAVVVMATRTRVRRTAPAPLRLPAGLECNEDLATGAALDLDLPGLCRPDANVGDLDDFARDVRPVVAGEPLRVPRRGAEDCTRVRGETRRPFLLVARWSSVGSLAESDPEDGDESRGGGEPGEEGGEGATFRSVVRAVGRVGQYCRLACCTGLGGSVTSRGEGG